MKCKRQRERGGVQGETEKKMRCSNREKREEEEWKPRKKKYRTKKKWLVCKCGVKEFRRREDV